MADAPITEPELKFARFVSFLQQHAPEHDQTAVAAMTFDTFMPLVQTFVTPHYEVLLAFRDKAVRTPPTDDEAREWARTNLWRASALVAMALGNILQDDSVKADSVVKAVRYLVYFVEIALIRMAHEG